MAELILGPMLRHVTARTATIWVETDASCVVEILGHSTRTFCVARHHYALVIVDGLAPGSTTEYVVRLDGERCWPAEGSQFPPSRIRTLHEAMTPRIVFGSCRTAAPHTAPWSLEMTIDPTGRGVDAVYAYALRMIREDPAEWPDLAVFIGDQIYADDSSPKTRARIAARRDDRPGTLPPELVHGFQEFCWLYEESWSSDVERWFLSVVPSAMIFDDHDMIDDWNISSTWIDKIRREPWWEDHVLSGLMTYWIYQHLGNLSPDTIRDEGLLDTLIAQPDGAQVLREWARNTEEFTSGPDRYRFSFVRDLGPARLVMIDARNGRNLAAHQRRIIDQTEWDWVAKTCRAEVDHLLIGSSLPAFIPGGLHDLQVWTSALCDRRWGRAAARFGEWLRVSLDLEDWPAFIQSFDDLVALLSELGDADRAHTPTTISLLSGDIHFSYVSRIDFPTAMSSSVHQLVNSPIRNALRPHERLAMRVAMSHAAIALGRVLRRAVGARRAIVRWKIDQGPVFENCLGRLDFDQAGGTMVLERAKPSDSEGDPELEQIFTTDLTDVATTSPPAFRFRRSLRPWPKSGLFGRRPAGYRHATDEPSRS